MSLKKSYAFTVQPQAVDFRHKLTLSSLTRILLTAADMNAEDNGFGLRRLQELNCGWVLTKLVVEMDYFPEQYASLSVETWVEDVGRASTTRNFCLRNGAGEIIGHACTLWVMLDMNSRRIKDLTTLDGIAGFANGETVPIEKPIKLTGLHEAELQYNLRIRYSDTDFNGHVSTERYVRWIGDCFAPEQYETGDVKRFEINFISEMMYGDEVKVWNRMDEPNDYRFELNKGDALSCRARVVF